VSDTHQLEKVSLERDIFIQKIFTPVVYRQWSFGDDILVSVGCLFVVVAVALACALSSLQY